MSLFQKNLLLGCFLLTSTTAFAINMEEERQGATASAAVRKDVFMGFSYTPDEDSCKKINHLVTGSEKGPYPKQFQPRFNILMVDVKERNKVTVGHKDLSLDYVEKEYGHVFNALKKNFEKKLPTCLQLVIRQTESLEEFLRKCDPERPRTEDKAFPYISAVFSDEDQEKLKNLNDKACNFFTSQEYISNLSIKHTTRPDHFSKCMTVGRAYGDDFPKEQREEMRRTCAETLQGRIPEGGLSINCTLSSGWVKYDREKHCPVNLSKYLKQPEVRDFETGEASE